MRHARRGTSNGNARGNSTDRARRRAYLLQAFQSNKGPGTCRCYRCGRVLDVLSVTVDRITPGCHGGRYVRNNIRPACERCNSETGGATRSADRRRS
jgi:5-methylcytosine-specific restriction endonuclease McrA